MIVSSLVPEAVRPPPHEDGRHDMELALNQFHIPDVLQRCLGRGHLAAVDDQVAAHRQDEVDVLLKGQRRP